MGTKDKEGVKDNKKQTKKKRKTGQTKKIYFLLFFSLTLRCITSHYSMKDDICGMRRVKGKIG